jgi:hypothetical protein
MKISGTKEAFIQVLSERGVYRKLGVERSTTSNWKRALEGKDEKNMPTLDKMEEMLAQYGAVVLSEKIWKLP